MNRDERASIANRVTWEGVAVNIFLLIFKFAAGIFGHSQAMIADALHTLSDFVSDLIVFVGIRISRIPQDSNHKYGHGKFESLAAMLVGLLLLIVGVKIGLNALRSLLDAFKGSLPEQPGWIAFAAAIVSILLKEILFQRTIKVGKRIESDAVTANAWHHRSDALSSVGSAIGIGLAAFLGPGWAVMDPISAIAVSLLLIQASLGILKEQVGTLTERSLPYEQEKEILDIIRKFPSLSSPHQLRTRKVGSLFVIDVHVLLDPDMRVEEAHDHVSELERALRAHFGPDTILNIHMEPRYLTRERKSPILTEEDRHHSDLD